MNKRKKKIYCFAGIQNSGKTSSIFRILREVFKINFDYFLSTQGNHRDVIFSFEYQSYKIGINTMGDEEKYIEKIEGIKDFDNCDLILCACRTKGKTKDFIRECSKRNGYKIFFVGIEQNNNLGINKEKREEILNNNVQDFKEWAKKEGFEFK